MDFNTLEAIGFNYVMDLMQPASVFGRDLLRNLPPYKSKSELERELSNVQTALTFLQNNRADNIIHALSLFKDISRSISRCAHSSLDKIELFELKQFFIYSQQLKKEYAQFPFLSGVQFADLSVPLSLLSVGQEGGFYISDEYSKKLCDIRREKAELAKKRSKLQKEEYFAAHSAISAREEDEEAEVCASLSGQLRPFLPDISRNIQAIAALDLCIKKAELALRFSLSRPIIGEGVRFTDMYNPMIASGLSGNFVPVSIECNRGVTVITGANMGGKTVALKTIALNCALIMRGFFPFAAYSQMFFADFVDIILQGTATGGLSGFGSEAYAMDRLYKKAKKENGIILFDEFAGATNADEGAKIFRAAVKAFMRTDSVAVFSTHFDGAASEADAHYQVVGLLNAPKQMMEGAIRDFFAFKTGKKDDARSFDTTLISRFMDYGLVKTDTAAAAPKDAIFICRLLGMDKDILGNL